MSGSSNTTNGRLAAKDRCIDTARKTQAAPLPQTITTRINGHHKHHHGQEKWQHCRHKWFHCGKEKKRKAAHLCRKPRHSLLSAPDTNTPRQRGPLPNAHAASTRTQNLRET
eukprot:1032182-Rhodomonas_salina.3